MPVGPLFSILFFIMLFTLGLDSQFAMVEIFTKSIRELFNIPDKHKITVLVTSCALLFLIGISLCCPVIRDSFIEYLKKIFIRNTNFRVAFIFLKF
jgi:SNF family Na+-dependent transporter